MNKKALFFNNFAIACFEGLKNVMKTIRKLFLFLFLGLFICLFGLLLFFFSKIQFIELKADLKIQNQAVYKSLESNIAAYLNNYKKKYLWSINLTETVKKIESIYSGGEVHVKRKFPNRLIVFIKEEPAFLLLLKQNQFFYSVSKEGYIGSQKRAVDSLNFPILRGKAFEEKLELRQRVLKILQTMPETGKLFSLENISEILYDKDNDSLLFYLVSDYFIVELKEALSLKTIKNINFVLNYLRMQGRTKAFVDARAGKKIIVKKLNKG